MTRHHKRWVCWGTAIFLSAIYFVAAMLHWTHVWQTFPVAVSGFYIVGTFVLVLAGWLAETEVIRIRNDAANLVPASAPPAQSLPHHDTAELRDAEARAYVAGVRKRIQNRGGYRRRI